MHTDYFNGNPFVIYSWCKILIDYPKKQKKHKLNRDCGVYEKERKEISTLC